MSSILHPSTARQRRDIALHDSGEPGRAISSRQRSASASSQVLSARSSSANRVHRCPIKVASWTSTATSDHEVCHSRVAESETEQSSLLVDEISAIDSFEFGSGAIGSVRLDFVKLPAAKPEALTKRYVSPFGLRDPVRLVVRRGELTIASAPAEDRDGSAVGLATSKTIATFLYSEISKVELRRDASLFLRRVDGLEVAISMHSAPKLIAAYKVVVLRCRGAVPKRLADANHFLEKALASEIDSAISSQTQERGQVGDDYQHNHYVAPHVTSVILPKPSHSRSSSSTTGVRDVLLPPTRTVPNRTAKTPISETLASFSTSSREGTENSGCHSDGKRAVGTSPSTVDVRIQHNLESSPSLAAREDRRKQLRDQLLELKKHQSCRAKPSVIDR